MRTFTPRDQEAVKTAAQTLRTNPKLDVETAITELGVGEALLSFLDARGTLGIVDRAWVLPPSSRIGPLTADERVAAIKASLLYGHYEKTEDRESAYEKLREEAATAKAEATPSQEAPTPAPQASGGILGELGDMFGGGGSRGRQGNVEAAVKSAVRTMGSQVGREIIRGVLGSILGGRRR